MGRPLNKKYFGNRNIGSTGTGDNYGIGGEGLASISTATAGAIQINDTYKTFPALGIAAPNLPSGVQATNQVIWEIAAITVYGGGNDYTNNQTGASAILTGLSAQADVAPVVTINTNGSNAVSAISVTGGRGEFTDVDGTGISTWGIDGAGGDTGQATVTFRIKRIEILEKGSGYTAVPSLTWSQTNGGTMPSDQTPTLTTDSGAAGSSTNQENAILVTAFIPTANGGSSAVIGDIVKQTNDKRYKVKTAQGTGICQLVTDGVANAAGEVSIKATDSEGKNYLVAKLTARKVVLVPAALGGSAGTQFASGTSAKWTFGDAVLNTTVTIENA